MQPQLLKIITALCILLVVLGGFFLVFSWFSTPSAVPNTQTPPSGGSYSGGGSNQSSVEIPSPASGQEPPVLDIPAAYTVLFDKILAKKVLFTRVSSSTGTGEMGSIYNLYTKDVADSKELFPAQKDFSIGVALLDVTDDGIAEALVFEDLPGYCGTGGCTFDIYKKQNGKWVSVYSALAQGEIGLANTITNGYQDIFLSVHSDGSPNTNEVRYVWDGKTYKAGEAMAIWDGSTFHTAQ